MTRLRQITNIRRLPRVGFVAFALMSSLSATDAGITFTPGHIYSTLTDSGGFDSGYRNIIEYDASGAVLGSLVIPSLAQEDTLKGIAFGPDGLLYAVKTTYWHSPNDLTVLVLDSSGAVHRTYTNHESSSDIFDGNIAVSICSTSMWRSAAI